MGIGLLQSASAASGGAGGELLPRRQTADHSRTAVRRLRALVAVGAVLVDRPRCPPRQHGTVRLKILAEREIPGATSFVTGRTYREPKLVPFTCSTRTLACGTGESAQGPFYGPGDQKVYIDLVVLSGAGIGSAHPGVSRGVCHCARGRSRCAESARHHRQDGGGTVARVRSRPMRCRSPRVRGRLSAGVWGKRTDSVRHVLEPEIEQALSGRRDGDDHCRNARADSRGGVVY